MKLICLFIALLFAPSLSFACTGWTDSISGRNRILSISEKAIREASRKILKLREVGDFQLQQKQNFSDFKTKGDCTSQDTVLGALSKDKLTKKANFIGEEKCKGTANLLEQKDNKLSATWILDPIDGTTNYTHGMPHFSISLALVVNKTICFGAVYAPVYNEFFFAFADQGAFLKKGLGQAKKISVSKIDELKSSLWITGTEGGPKAEAAKKNKNTFEIALELLPKSHDLRRTGSAALDLASVASGRVEGYFELSEGLNWWDIAAGILLVSEAGGKVSVKEPEGSTNQNSAELERPIVYILATNGALQVHDEFKKRMP